jgi:hypothetical protein
MRGKRRARREELFPTDRPVEPDLMIGRANDVLRIASALEAGQNLRILAPRRTGKTTVCNAALARLCDRGWYAASLDLMHPAGAAGLAQDLTRSLLACRPQFQRALSEARNGWERLSDRLRVEASLDLGEGVRIAFGSGGAPVDPHSALAEALALSQRLAEKDGRPVALFIDELQELAAPAAPFGDPQRLQALMRSTFQRSNEVSFLFAGSREHAMEQIFQPDAPLGGFGGGYALTEITAAEWASGIGSRFELASITADPAVVKRLVELGAGHPRATMLIAAEAFVAAREAGASALEASFAELAWDQACLHDAERCRLVVERMRRLRFAKGTDVALRVARALAGGQPPYAVGAHAEQVRRALDSLSDIGVAEQLGRGSWRIGDPILRAHLTVGSA